MKKIFVFIVLAIMAMGGIKAQNMFFPTKEGMILEYANLNNRGRADSYTRQTIQSVQGSGDNLTVSYVSQAFDRNRRPTATVEIPYSVTISNGVVELDMKSFAAAGTEGLIEIEGDKLRIPSTLSPGVKLDDVNFTLTVNMGFRIRTEISLTEQECLAIEEITVPAGTFNCYKVTQTSAATAMRRTMTTKTITWYAHGIGTVKSETYDARNRLTSSMELQSVENN